MKKTRTLEIRRGGTYYRGKYRGIITYFIRDHFKLPYSGKVRITIEGKGPYTFEPFPTGPFYDVYKHSQYIGIVCSEKFERLFFKPVGHRGYDIIVKEVK